MLTYKKRHRRVFAPREEAIRNKGDLKLEHRDIVVIGASAGGLEAISQILPAMPHDVDAAILIVLHTADRAGSLLPQILKRVSKLPVCHPADGDVIQRGRVYVAPPGFHMIIEGGTVRVVQGPRENLHRPAIDPLFRSAAAATARGSSELF